MTYHNPVMLKESVEGLNIRPNGVYVDTTFGGGGHSREILAHLDKKGKLIAFDQDSDAIRNVPGDNRIIFINNNFRFVRNFLRFYHITKVDGIIADLGVSSHHFDTPERGFSFRFDEKIDMRMDINQKLSAQIILNTYNLDALERIFREFGEIGNAKKLAAEIDNQRRIKTIEYTSELREIVCKCYGKNNEIKLLPQVFQALRIEVNKELKALEDLLEASTNILNKGGRLVIITYHSLEDRLVKNFMKSGKFSGEIEKDFYGNVKTPFDVITKKAVIPTKDEIHENPRSRSAKLRIVELKA